MDISNSRRSDDAFIIILWILLLSQFIFDLFSLGVVLPNLILACLISAIEFIVCIFSKRDQNTTIYCGFLVILALIFVLFEGTLGYPYLKKWMTFAMSIMHFCFCFSARLSKRTVRFIYGSSLIMILLYFIKSFSPDMRNITGELVYKTGNENSAAMLILVFVFLFISASALMKYKGIIHKIINTLAILAGIYLINETGSRTSLVALFLFAILYLKKKFHISNIVIYAFVLFPLVFALIYCNLWERGLFVGSSFMGGPFYNGRQLVWLETFKQPLFNILTGSYLHFTIREGTGGDITFQLHNGVVDMIASYGVIITGLYLYMVIVYLKRLNNRYERNAYVVMIVLLMVMFESVGEAAFLIGGFRSVLIGIIICFANGLSDEKEYSKG